MPKAGTAKAWITSAPVVWIRTILLTGTTISLSTPSSRGFLSCGQQRIEFELAVIGIGVAPVPLLAGRLDGEVGLGNVELQEQQPERRHRDGDQDQHRNQGPGDFDQGVVGGLGGDRVGLGVELHHDHDQQHQHEQRDDGDDPDQQGMEPGDVVHHRRGRFLQGPFPTARAGPIRPKPPRRPPAQRLPPPNPATVGQSGPSTSSCRSRSHDEFPKLNPQSIPPDGGKCCTIRPQTNGLGKYCLEYRGQKARTRRNPASQTIILRLSQCSSKAWRGASPAIRRMSHFPVKSGQSPILAARSRLTAGLPDVGTDRVIPRRPDSPDGAPIPALGSLEYRLQGAVIAVSVQGQSNARTGPA